MNQSLKQKNKSKLMKKIPSFILFTFMLSSSYGQDTIYSIAYHPNQPYSNFENRDQEKYFAIDRKQLNNIWNIGKPYKPFFKAAYSIPLALVTDTSKAYPNSNVSSLEFVIKTDDLTNIGFWHRFNTDSLSDGGTIEVSLNGGASWANIVDMTNFSLNNCYSKSSKISSNNNKPGFSGNSNWIHTTISSGALNYARFRFTFTSDNIDSNKDGWMLDNFTFGCIGTGINEVGTDHPFKIFPNPTSGLISILSDNKSLFKSATIKDVLGKILLITDSPTLDLSSLEIGLYYLEISSDKGKYWTRLSKD
jgi:hypothetical protein